MQNQRRRRQKSDFECEATRAIPTDQHSARILDGVGDSILVLVRAGDGGRASGKKELDSAIREE